MDLEMTFDDPKAYVRPFTIKIGVNYVPDDDLIENVCLENENDHLAIELGGGGGKQTVFPTSDNVFVFPSTGGTVTFVRDPKKNNAVTHFLLTIVEGDFRADRK